MLLVRSIRMGTYAEYRKDHGGAARGNALNIAGVPPQMATRIRSQMPLSSRADVSASQPFGRPGAHEIVG